jgi:hypothetical protein
MEQITTSLVSSSVRAPVVLDMAQLSLVAGGLPKGTWSELQGLPKGTWAEALGLPKGTWEASLPKGTW